MNKFISPFGVTGSICQRGISMLLQIRLFRFSFIIHTTFRRFNPIKFMGMTTVPIKITMGKQVKASVLEIEEFRQSSREGARQTFSKNHHAMPFSIVKMI